jgi:hypothetical protein
MDMDTYRSMTRYRIRECSPLPTARAGAIDAVQLQYPPRSGPRALRATRTYAGGPLQHQCVSREAAADTTPSTCASPWA